MESVSVDLCQPRSEYAPSEMWSNPICAGRYGVVVIGRGERGIAAAMRAASRGRRAAIIGQGWLDDTCVALGRASRQALAQAAAAAHRAVSCDHSATQTSGVVDFAAIMAQVRQAQVEADVEHSPWRLTGHGIDVIEGCPSFKSETKIEVAGQTLAFRRAVIDVLPLPLIPDIDGLADVPHYSRRSLLTLRELPARVAVLGSGPLACEWAQAFRRFGSVVHLVTPDHGLLAGEEPAAADGIARQVGREGVHTYLATRVLRVEKTGHFIGLLLDHAGQKRKLVVDAVLVAAGGTTAKEVPGRDIAAARCREVQPQVLTRVVYTDPEVARVGMSTRDLARCGISSRCEIVELPAVDGRTTAILHRAARSGRMLGATVLGHHAAHRIGEYRGQIEHGNEIEYDSAEKARDE